MKKLLLAAVMVVSASSPAYAMTYFLTNQWYNSSGQRMCQYGNGTVLNIGVGLCALSIQG